MNVVSITILSIIGIIFFVGVVLFVIFQLEMDHKKMVLVETDNQKKVWVEIYRSGEEPFSGFNSWRKEKSKTFNNAIPESSNPYIEYLKTKNIVVYDFKSEHRPELAEMCEGLNCLIGVVDSYLISEKDVPEFNKLVYTARHKP